LLSPCWQRCSGKTRGDASESPKARLRGIYRERGCSSLYTYLIYELRMSEDAAFRRARAARIVRQFPILLEKIATGEIHLTGLLLLGPHLTQENYLQVLVSVLLRTRRRGARVIKPWRTIVRPSVPTAAIRTRAGAGDMFRQQCAERFGNAMVAAAPMSIREAGAAVKRAISSCITKSRTRGEACPARPT
jgi:hypothetical protein